MHQKLIKRFKSLFLLVTGLFLSVADSFQIRDPFASYLGKVARLGQFNSYGTVFRNGIYRIKFTCENRT